MANFNDKFVVERDRLTVTAPSSQDSALTDIDFSLLAVTDGEVGQNPE